MNLLVIEKPLAFGHCGCHQANTKAIPLQAIVNIVSSPGRDSRDLRSSRVAEATQKRWVQTHFELVTVYLSGSFSTFIQYLQNCFFKSLAIITILRPF